MQAILHPFTRRHAAWAWLLVWGAGAAYFFGKAASTMVVPSAPPSIAATPVSGAPRVQLKPIEEVKAGERVISFDPESGQWSPRTVIRPLQHDYDGDLITITIPGDRIEATGNHPFWVASGPALSLRPAARDVPSSDRREMPNGGRWVEARHLQVGDLLLIRDGHTATVEEAASRRAKLKVYNLEVADLHTYAVGAEGVVVHNKAIQIAGIPQEPSVVNLWELGSRTGLRGGGIYTLNNAETGEILKVGKTANFFERSATYARLQPWAGRLQMNLYPIQGNLDRTAAEIAFRNNLLGQGESLFWDGTGDRAVEFGFAPGEWDLPSLVKTVPGFGKAGWSIPMANP